MHLVAAPSRIATVLMNSGNTREALNKHVDNEDKPLHRFSALVLTTRAASTV